MTPAQRLAALKAIAEAATPGEWNVGPDKGLRPCVGASSGALIAGDISWDMGRSLADAMANATHIAAFDPPTVAWLIGMAEKGLESGWRPIETYLRRGEPAILGRAEDDYGPAEVKPGYYSKPDFGGVGWADQNGAPLGFEPTHWQPLPDLPPLTEQQS